MKYEKQIEEMAQIIQSGELARNRGDLDCTEFPTDLVIKVGMQRLAGAKALFNEGYRKQSEVAEEIFAEIYEDCFDQFGYINYEALAELKKKYTENRT